jgi:thiol-disulfide isomerase/thioredoxin
MRFLAITLLAISLPGMSLGQSDLLEGAVIPDLIPITASSVLELVNDHSDGPILVNMWATWCKPCREEMPDLLRLLSEHESEGFKLILVSADFTRQSEQAAKYLGSLGVDFESYIKNQLDDEFINKIDPAWSGALPFSMLFDKEGNVIRSWEGKLAYKEVNDLLNGQK